MSADRTAPGPIEPAPLSLSLSMNLANIQQPPSNAQHPMNAPVAPSEGSRLEVGGWKLDVTILMLLQLLFQANYFQFHDANPSLPIGN